MTKSGKCPECGGNGLVQRPYIGGVIVCPECKGENLKAAQKTKQCEHCGGLGSRLADPCLICKGEGYADALCEYCDKETGEHPVLVTYGDNEANMRQTRAFCRMTCLWNWMLAG